MVNPYWTPTYVPAAVLAVAAGMLPMRPRYYLFGHFVLLGAAAILFHVFLVRYVAWGYEHPFTPTDSGPRAFAAVFGWLFGLVWPILPVYAATHFLSWLIARYAVTRTI